MLGNSDPVIVEVNGRALAEHEALLSINTKSL